MQTFKTLALGILFSLIGTLTYFYFALVRGQPLKVNSAIGIDGLISTLKDHILLNPIYWFGLLLAFGLAFWLVRHFQRA